MKLPVPSAWRFPVPHQSQSNRHCTACFRGACHAITGSIDDQVTGRAGRNGIHDNRYRWRSGANVASRIGGANAIGVTSLAERGGWRPAPVAAGIGVHVATSAPLSKMLTALLASAVPLSVGCVSLVDCPLPMAPVLFGTSSTMLVISEPLAQGYRPR
ncbi:Uncharacterised protein [Salmonella enterica subsp. enterica]|uniref:Uncharacterized protein n=1 Tax=Salmonella enterica I TaxID=59201 RepID=A0A379W549_SALET|nr:Uncharacterised protein [Salmonella enterica subsp. enterica]